MLKVLVPVCTQVCRYLIFRYGTWPTLLESNMCTNNPKNSNPFFSFNKFICFELSVSF